MLSRQHACMNTPSTPTQLADCTAHELQALYRSGQTTPVEATQAVLARIEQRNQDDDDVS
jgi:Asp-tRNA(Asn)/Glu-tRNA(Gln) amidotransferase A subunit family amidase